MNPLTKSAEHRRCSRKVYAGCRGPDGCVVWVIDGNGERKRLNPRRALRNHSPTGFEWGYGGSGPAQLALAILAEHLGDDHAALRLYQDFKDTGRQLVAVQRGNRQLPRSTVGTTTGQSAPR